MDQNKLVNAIAIIPAKGNSTRLPGKNLKIIKDKTLLEYSIDYAKSSKYVSKIYVSTDSEKIKDLAIKNNVEVIDRPESLLGEAEVADIYVDLINKINNEGITHVIGLQPDHPDRQNNLDKIISYFVEKKYMDLVTVDKNGTRNGSVRVIEAEYVKTGMMSRRVGAILDDCINVEHDWQLKEAEKKIIDGEYYESK